MNYPKVVIEVAAQNLVTGYDCKKSYPEEPKKKQLSFEEEKVCDIESGSQQQSPVYGCGPPQPVEYGCRPELNESCYGYRVEDVQEEEH